MNTGTQGEGDPAFVRQKRAFTIVEMLAVLAILAIVAALAMPAVTSLVKGPTRQTAVSLVLSTLDQARALALSQNTPHYFVVADLNPAWPADHRCRAFAIYSEVFNPAAARYDHFQVGNWMLLPVGLAFEPADDTVFSGTKEKFHCPPAGGEIEAPCFKFNSIGGLDEPIDAKVAQLRLFEGTVKANGEAILSHKAGTEREELLRVSLATGRARRVEPESTPAPQP